MKDKGLLGRALASLALPALCALGPMGSHAAPANAKPDRPDAVWVSDRGDGTYKNPVLFADYSDPDAIRVGDDFYMTASSFNSIPGLPILHSKDLVNWTIIGHALSKQPPFDVFDKPQHGSGVWAPAIRHHRGEFYLYYPDPDFGIYLVKAKNPAGPWSEPLLVQAGKGLIDPCPLWDDDGKAYLVHAWAGSRAGIKNLITVKPMSPDGTKILGTGQMVFDGRLRHPTIEGPKFYKRNGYYYIFAPAGGVKTGWQTVLRSKNVYGPYEDKIVLHQGATAINGPHQGAWVQTRSGEDWFLHFQDRGAYGRILHLQPMKWVNDWPVIGVDKDGDGTGEPVLTYRKPNVGKSYPLAVPRTGDEFDSGTMGRQWQWHANPQESWLSPAARRGWLRLISVPLPENAVSLWSAPNLLLQKLPGPAFTATARLDVGSLAVGERTGLLMMGRDYAYLAVERTPSGYRVVQVSCPNAREGGKENERGAAPFTGSSLLLRVTVDPGAVCRFSYSRDGKDFAPLGEPFTAREGHWIGAKVGLFAQAESGARKTGHVDVDWFRFEKGKEGDSLAASPPPAAPAPATPTVRPAGLHTDIEYGRAGDESLRLDASVPPGDGPFPVAIVMHGGGWGGGDKAEVVAPMTEPLTRAGFTWFSINYRLAPKNRWPAAFGDVQTAIRWVKANAAEFKGDPTRIALIGYSAGGHLACLTAVRADKETLVQAVVGFAPPTDLPADTERRGGLSKALQDLLDRPQPVDLAAQEILQNLSPITYVRPGLTEPGLPPFLLIHGTKDESVPYSQSVNFQKRLREIGVPCDLIPIEGAPHRLRDWDNLDASYREKMAAWLRQTLGGR